MNLQVWPKDEMPTFMPGNNLMPWHISVSFYDSSKSHLFDIVESRFSTWQPYTLVGYIQGTTFRLSNSFCPIGSCEEIISLIDQDIDYWDRHIHMSL